MRRLHWVVNLERINSFTTGRIMDARVMCPQLQFNGSNASDFADDIYGP